MPRYDPQRIEPKWQHYWDDQGTFVTSNTPPEGAQGTLYILDMFPYPSGSGLHVGHPEGYTATDILCRYGRMRGKHVLHPMGWDAFGLPAEQHAIKTRTHPRAAVQENIETFRRQLKMLGFSYDWSRELSTTDEDYYRWTQWIFLQLFDTWYDAECDWTGPDGKTRTGRGRPISELPIPDEIRARGDRAVRIYQDEHRLAYISEAPVNWCPKLGTVLANEEVIDGKSERGSHPVIRIPLRQWMLRIRKYADRLLAELDDVDWPESIKLLQRNWIGRSTGAEVDFFVPQLARNETTDTNPTYEDWTARRATDGFSSAPDPYVLRVYTTRPDTLFGATYMVVAPEHPLVDRLTTEEQRASVDAYREQAARKSDLDRTDLAREKSGVFTGSHAVNPVNGQRIPIWIADYVLISYGTGAIMAVPGQDERDWDFAEVYDLPIIRTVQPPDDFNGKAYTGDGPAINSGPLDGLHIEDAKQRIIAILAEQGLGCEAVNYRLRDWLFSRQHYWGEPFPIWHELDSEGNPTGLMRADSPEDLPVRLPEQFDFTPHGRPEPPLDDAPEDWLYKTADDGVRLKRETNSMPQWAGSCWYYLRFCDPENSERFIDPEIEKYWMPVDVYIGGVEHAVLHLLYARFWHKVLFDRGHVSTPEPFQRLVNQGMILGEAEITGYALAEAFGDQSAADDERVINFSDVPPHAWVSAQDTATKTLESGEDVRVQKGTGAQVLPVRIDSEEAEKREGRLVLASDPAIGVESRAFKMSKSRGNVVNPDSVVSDYSADALRMYEMFMGPLEQVKPWNMSGVEGVYRFLGRVWRMIVDERADDHSLAAAVQDATLTPDQERLLHQTIRDVTRDIEKLSFNTAISRLMEFTNAMTACDVRPRGALEPFLLLLSPFAPHIAEELWELLGHTESLAYESWPTYDEAKLVTDEIEIPVQVNGKVRARIFVSADADQPTVEQAARADESVAKHLDGKQIVKTIFVPGRMLNLVVRG